MLTKEKFVERLKFIKTYCDKMDKFDLALKDLAKSDFTGFYDTYLTTKLTQFLAQDMDDVDDWIGWWICETEWGQRKEMCKVWENGDEDKEPDYIIETPEQLYDFLVINYIKPISKDNLDMVIKSQDTGVKFALKEIQNLQDKNATTKNDGWEEREAVMSFVKSSITNSYLLNRGIDANLNYQENFNIISTL